ncbi:MAG: hypothetical protein Q8O83_01760 [bacterium]|nr:hypothetical protein [bacterium]
MELISPAIEETVEFKDEFIRHFILYAKGHYKREDTVSDLRTIIAKICNIPEKSVSIRDVLSRTLEVFNSVFRYEQNSNQIQAFLSVLVSDLMDDFEDFAKKKELTKTKEIILETFIQGIMNYLNMLQVRERQDGKIFLCGNPDPVILPLDGLKA